MEFHNQNGISGQMKNTGKKNKIAGFNQQSFNGYFIIFYTIATINDNAISLLPMIPPPSSA